MKDAGTLDDLNISENWLVTRNFGHFFKKNNSGGGLGSRKEGQGPPKAKMETTFNIPWA